MKVSGRTEDINSAIARAQSDGLSREEYLEVATYLENVSIDMKVPTTSPRKSQIIEARNAALRKAAALTPAVKKHFYEKPSGIILLGVSASLIAAFIWWYLNIPPKT